MKKSSSFIYTLFNLFMFCTSSLYADTSTMINGISATSLIVFLTIATLSIVIVGLLLYGCIKNLSAKSALLASCTSNALLACILVPLIRFAHLGWWNTLVRFNDAPVQALSLWALLYLASTVITIGAIHVLFKYPIKQLLIPVGIGNFIVFVLIINGYIFITLYRFHATANAFTRGLIGLFNKL